MKILVIGKEGRLAKMSRPGRLEAHQLTYIPMDAEMKDIVAAGRDAEVILIDAMGRLPAEAIKAFPRLKMIHSEGVGYQGVDIKAAREAGVDVCNCQGMNATAVAEDAILLMLGCLKDVVNNNQNVLEGRQITVKEGYMAAGSLRELADCTIGFVGFGDIGRETARMAAAFGAECIYFNRSAAPREKEYGAVRMSLDEVLAKADILSLHLPVTPETRNIADDAFFAKVRPGAILINTARGELVDSAALLRAMEAGIISQAGLDCIAGEPVQKDNLLVRAPEEIRKRILFSPHIGGITRSSFLRGYEMFWTNVDRVAAGERPQRIVNP